MRFTAEELTRKLATEGSRTDWAKADAVSDSALERMIAQDPDDPANAGWSVVGQSVKLELPTEMMSALPPPGAARDMEVSRIVRNYLKRKLAPQNRAG